MSDRPPYDFVSPAFLRCLLTVRAAISFARFVDLPDFFSDSLTCSYCRSRLSLQDFGIVEPPSVAQTEVPGLRAFMRYSSGGFWTSLSSAYFCVNWFTTSIPSPYA